MKKANTIVLLALVIMLFGCTNNNSYKTTVVQSADGIDVASEKGSEYAYLYDREVKENMPNKIFNFEGEEYPASYIETRYHQNRSYRFDLYRDEEYREFYVREDTGELVSAYVLVGGFLDAEYNKDTVENIEEVMREYGKKYASMYLKNPENYKIIIEEPHISGENTDKKLKTYALHYQREISGYKTSDEVIICVTQSGRIYGFSVFDADLYDNNLTIDKAKIEESIKASLNDLAKSSDWNIVENEIYSQQIILRPDGKYALMTRVKVSLKNKSNEIINTGVEFSTIIGKK